MLRTDGQIDKRTHKAEFIKKKDEDPKRIKYKHHNAPKKLKTVSFKISVILNNSYCTYFSVLKEKIKLSYHFS